MVSSPPLSAEYLDKVETMVQGVAAQQFTCWESAAIETARALCRYLRELSGQTRREALDLLAKGVEGRRLLVIMGPMMARLRPLQKQMESILAIPIKRPIAEPVVDLLIDCAAMSKDMLSLIDLLAEPLAIAALPPPALDEEKVARLKAAFARGESKSIQRPDVHKQG